MQQIIYNKPLKYKELVEVLQLDHKKGGNRVNQISQISRKYHIEKYGTYYIIVNELNQLEKITATPRLKFQDYIIPLVYTYMHIGKYESGKTITKGNMLKDLCMINDNFYAVKEDPYKYALMFDDVDGLDLLRYTETTYKMMCNALDSACLELSNRKLAHVDKIKMTLQVYTKNGKVKKKAVPLNDAQLTRLTEIQREYMQSHINNKTGDNYEYWNDIPYMEMRDATKWVAKEIGYNTFDGYKLLINKKGVEQYMAQNLPDMQHALLDLVEHKIITTTRKGIGNLSKDTRIILARELNSNRNKLVFKSKEKEEE